MQIAAIITLIQGALAAAPQIEAVITAMKDFISGLFKGGLLTQQQQDALHQYVDAVATMVKAGVVPSHWQVQPDPVTSTTQTAGAQAFTIVD